MIKNLVTFKIANSLAFLIPIIGLIAGLSLSITIPLFVIALLSTAQEKLTEKINKNFIELSLIIWIFLSCLWSLDKILSLYAYLKFFICCSIFYIASFYDIKYIHTRKFQISLLFGVIICVLLFYIELSSNGVITTIFKKTFQKNSDYKFYLHLLNRGCSFLALTSWIIIIFFIKQQKNIYSLSFYLVILITLGMSDSSASFLGFIAAGIVFLITRYITFFRNPKILSTILILFSLSVPLIIGIYKPTEILNKAQYLPISAKHRIFIWDYVYKQTNLRPFHGWGYESARIWPVHKDEYVNLEGENLSPLPLHPHNHLLQISFEGGMIGLILYLCLMCKFLFYTGNHYLSHNKTSLNIISCGYAGFTTYFIISLISYDMWQSWWLCTYLWAALIFFWIDKKDA